MLDAEADHAALHVSSAHANIRASPGGRGVQRGLLFRRHRGEPAPQCVVSAASRDWLFARVVLLPRLVGAACVDRALAVPGLPRGARVRACGVRPFAANEPERLLSHRRRAAGHLVRRGEDRHETLLTLLLMLLPNRVAVTLVVVHAALPREVTSRARSRPAASRRRTRTRRRRPSRTLPAFCRVAATLKPTERLRHQDRSLAAGRPSWNGKFQAVGNGAFNGSIAYPAMMTALAPRLRDQLHRHRPHRQHRALRARASRRR